jgi:Asp-tRNA(Asn)/Glu-tRNA(Gln) amidotransferase A subunit family amidase
MLLAAGRIIPPMTTTELLTQEAPLAASIERLRAGAIDLATHVDAICDRLDAVEDRVRAYVPEPDRRERLHDAVAVLERRWPTPETRPPLYGVAVGVKDIIAVDGLPTRGGSMVPSEALAMPEAEVVTALREAGALVIGKTVTTEFAAMDPGPTANPHDPRRTPGGSSSGSAAAVAVGTAQLALGSQTVGSVIRPAAFCGVVGFKPSYGRIPTGGILYYSRSVDHVGLFAQDVAGLQIAATVAIPGWGGTSQGPVAEAAPVIGVPDGPYLEQADAAGLEGLEAALARLEAAGLEVRRVPLLDDITEINTRHRQLTLFEFGEEHAERFARYGGLYRPHNATNMDRARELPPGAANDGRAGRAALREQLHAAMSEHGVDLWASPPATGPAPLGLGATGNPTMNLPWTHAGVPTVTLPAGRAEGVPLGLQLSGRFGGDEVVLAQAAQIQPLLGLD